MRSSWSASCAAKWIASHCSKTRVDTAISCASAIACTTEPWFRSEKMSWWPGSPTSVRRRLSDFTSLDVKVRSGNDNENQAHIRHDPGCGSDRNGGTRDWRCDEARFDRPRTVADCDHLHDQPDRTGPVSGIQARQPVAPGDRSGWREERHH